MLISLLGYFFCMVMTLTAVMAFLVNFSNNYTSAGEKGHYSRPIIVQTVTAGETAPWRSPAAKDPSPAKDATPVVPTAKTHKPKVLARQRNNNGYGNEYAYRNDPRGFFIH